MIILHKSNIIYRLTPWYAIHILARYKNYRYDINLKFPNPLWYCIFSSWEQNSKFPVIGILHVHKKILGPFQIGNLQSNVTKNIYFESGSNRKNGLNLKQVRWNKVLQLISFNGNPNITENTCVWFWLENGVLFPIIVIMNYYFL